MEVLRATGTECSGSPSTSERSQFPRNTLSFRAMFKKTELLRGEFEKDKNMGPGAAVSARENYTTVLHTKYGGSGLRRRWEEDSR